MQSRMYSVATSTSTAGRAPDAVGPADQALGNNRLQRARHLQTDLLLLRGRKYRDNTLDGFRGVGGVQGGEHHVARFRRQQGRLDGFQVAHFAHQDHVGVLAQGGAQGAAETRRVHFHFALVDKTLLVAVKELDGIFDGNDVVSAWWN